MTVATTLPFNLSELSDRKLTILELVSRNLGITSTSLSQQAGISKEHVRRVVKQLEHQGFLTHRNRKSSHTHHFYLAPGVNSEALLQIVAERKTKVKDPVARAVLRDISLVLQELSRSAGALEESLIEL